VRVERHDELAGRHARPHAEVERVVANHPPQKQVEPLARAALRRLRKEVADAWPLRHTAVRGFQIERITPIEEFNGDDDASMAANNTSAFNCRDVTGQPGKFSNHSWGRAIDINPLINPYVKGDKIYPPEGRKTWLMSPP